MKGIFTQVLAVLFEAVPTLDQLAEVVARPVLRRTERTDGWEVASPGLLLEYDPEVNGIIDVDVVDRPWPDHMGSPDDEGLLFVAWSQGHFGPFAYPGNLASAVQQDWHLPGEGADLVARHQGFVRVRMTYQVGQVDAPALPPNYDPRREVVVMTELAQRICCLPGALAWFNPSGAVLVRADDVAARIAHAEGDQRLPLDIWHNTRVWAVEDDWLLVDTCGLAQLDVIDLEAGFYGPDFEVYDVVLMLIQYALYLADRGDVFGDGDTINGPNDTLWVARRLDESFTDPPRPVVRFLPSGGPSPPSVLTAN